MPRRAEGAQGTAIVDENGTRFAAVVPVGNKSAVVVSEAGAQFAVPNTLDALTATARVLFNPRSNRRGCSVFNGTNKTVFVGLGIVPSVSSYTVKMEPGDYYEAPSVWQGEVQVSMASTGTGVIAGAELY